MSATEEQLKVRIHGDTSLPTLVYLPGLHGDWTLATSFRQALAGRVCFVELTYPRTLSWSLDEYATNIAHALSRHAINRCWLLGESYGSQIVWPLATRAQAGKSQIQIDGIVLAGGFVKHPNSLGIHFAKLFTDKLPEPFFRACLSLYALYAKLRHRKAPETSENIDEFLARRTRLDRQAMTHRLRLIQDNDPRLDVQQLRIPVYALSGFWDPIVPRFITRTSLEKRCPGFRAARTIWSADHNVLGTQPHKSAEIILRWMNNR